MLQPDVLRRTDLKYNDNRYLKRASLTSGYIPYYTGSIIDDSKAYYDSTNDITIIENELQLDTVAHLSTEEEYILVLTTDDRVNYRTRREVIGIGDTWTARTASVSNDWHSLCYGNGIFVAASDTGVGTRVMTSQDGINWQTQISAADEEWWTICYGNGIFVAIAYNIAATDIMTSPDGKNWTAYNSPSASTWYSVCYGNGLFVCVANTGSPFTTDTVMTSPDGITWTGRTGIAHTTCRWTSVCYGNELFVAVGEINGTGTRVMTSPDGITWTNRTSAADNNWQSLCYGNGLFVAVSNTGTGDRVMTSSDGITWTSRTSAADNDWHSVTYANSIFVAVAASGSGDRVMTSKDGITWSTKETPDSIWRAVCYGNDMAVAVGESGAVMTSGRTDYTSASYDNIYHGDMTVYNNLLVDTSITPITADGATLGTTALEFSDLYLADGSVIYLGDDQDVTLTHVADTGVLLNSNMQFQFRDSAIYIASLDDGHLDLEADTQIDLNSDTVVSGTLQANSVGIGVAPDATNILKAYRNDASTTPIARIEQDSTGDATITTGLSGTQWWTFGVDNSDGDRFKIEPAYGLTNANYFSMDTDGHIGIGNDPYSRTFLRVEGEITSTAAGYGMRLVPTFNISGSGGDYAGIFCPTYLEGTGSVDQFFSAYFYSLNTGNSNTLRRYEGFYCNFDANNSTMSTTQTFTMFQIRGGLPAGSQISVGTDYHHLWMTNTAGVFSVSGTMYGIKQEGSAFNNYFEGTLEIVSDSNGLELGAGYDAKIYYDGTDLIVDPDIVGSGIVLIGATGDDDMKLNTIEIDGDINHDGSNIGVFGTAPVAKQTVTGAKGGNAALTSLLTALATYGLITDSTT